MAPPRTHTLDSEQELAMATPRNELVAWLRNAVMEINPGLSGEQVLEEASLIHDLGFDSLSLESLLAQVKSRVPGIDLTPWYVRAARQGQDTIASLVDFLMEAANRPVEGDPT
jgi:hypothetical protein